VTVDNDEGNSGFAGLCLAPELRRALSSLGYEEPTPIQQAAIPSLLAGRDVAPRGGAVAPSGWSRPVRAGLGEPGE